MFRVIIAYAILIDINSSVFGHADYDGDGQWIDDMSFGVFVFYQVSIASRNRVVNRLCGHSLDACNNFFLDIVGKFFNL